MRPTSPPRGSWIEIRLAPGVEIGDIAASLVEEEVDGHAFYSEPWHPGGYVLRVHNPPSKELVVYDEPYEIVEWDPTPDEKLYGEKWPEVAAFFAASTKLGELSDHETRKLVHCFLNARGFSWNDEIRFHLRETWKRLSLAIRWRLYLGRRYAAENQDADK